MENHSSSFHHHLLYDDHQPSLPSLSPLSSPNTIRITKTIQLINTGNDENVTRTRTTTTTTQNISNLVKKCRVCGDKALGFNFNGLSCESCKSFFRRNAPKQIRLKCCNYDGKCLVNMASRKKCKACRLEKCIAIGMKKELLPTADLRRKTTTPNRNKNKIIESSNIQSSSSSSLSLSCHSPLFIKCNNTASGGGSDGGSGNANYFNSQLLQLLGNDQDDQNLSKFANNETSDLSTNKTKLEKGNINGNGCRRRLGRKNGKTSSSSSSPYPSSHQLLHSIDRNIRMPNSPTTTITYDLNAYERFRLLEVTNNSKIFCNELNFSVCGETQSMVQTYNLVSLYVERIIQFCKSIDSFRILKQSDQLIIVKAFYLEIMLIKFSYLYCPKKDGFPICEDEVNRRAIFFKVDFFKKIQNKGAIVADLYRKFVHALNQEMEQDSVIRDLLIVKLMFDKRDGISCPEFLRYNYFFYRHLLQRYLEQRYQNVEQARRKHAAIVEHFRYMYPLKEVLREIFLQDLDATQVAHVLKELFHQ